LASLDVEDMLCKEQRLLFELEGVNARDDADVWDWRAVWLLEKS
jgi:hypothetical protein